MNKKRLPHYNILKWEINIFKEYKQSKKMGNNEREIIYWIRHIINKKCDTSNFKNELKQKPMIKLINEYKKLGGYIPYELKIELDNE